MNDQLVLPIERMKIAERIDVIKCHGELLKKRAEAIERGDDTFMTLDEAAARIRQKTGREC